MRGIILLLALASFALVSSATAQDAAPEDDERARIHFESGRAHFEEGAYERAIEEFESAYELSHRPELLMNIASAHERLGRWGEAADFMERYLRDATEVENRDALERRIANLRARASGGDTGTGEDPDPAPTGGGSDARTIGAVVAFGTAGAGLAAFGIFGGLALGERSSLESGCGAARECDDGDVSGLRTLSLVADIGLVVAGVGAVAGVLVLLLVGDGGGGETDAASTRVSPWLGPEGGGLSVSGWL
jgi:tetratricopeptide (TPR) repeat protein